LLDLKSKKKCENHHHGHFKPISHDLGILKSFSMRKTLRHSYHALGAYLSP
jgi:hypothetical protein